MMIAGGVVDRGGVPGGAGSGAPHFFCALTPQDSM